MARRYNEITKIAKGKFIARFDADDICDPARFEKQVDFLNNNPSTEVVLPDDFQQVDRTDHSIFNAPVQPETTPPDPPAPRPS